VAGFLHTSRHTTAHQPSIGGLGRILKRAIDIVVSIVGLILTAPLLPVLAIAIKLDSPGPVFFIQERIGENGRPFQMIGMRTMADGKEDTRVGCLLRRTTLDRVPQLWNVLKGEMSLVGPRPEKAYTVHTYSDWHRQRLAVKPGITGPMQVSGRGDLNLDERVQLELAYIHNYSIWKDLVILARTVVAVLSGRGAY